MARIRQLPPELANQIAAGEVVERPASVVKELVENAIDAGASRITVAIEMGGKRLIRVEDDGEGMEPEDARLSLERHATSKIARAEDLEAIHTMGFRGEALPSIGSVSHLVLRTRTRQSDSGTELRVNGGVIASMTEVGLAPGTIVEVADLFYNLPARRKFLKSDVAESTQVSRMVTQLALANPRVGFTLTSGPRVLLRCPPASRMEDRFYQLHGERPDLVPVRKDAGGLSIRGFIAALAEQGPTRGAQQFFVNQRIVKDRTIAHAVVDAYAAATAKERSPEAYLFIEMPAESVDVNVHPTKAEVRFHQQSMVHEIVRRAVQDALGSGPAPELRLSPETGGIQAVNLSLPSLMAGLQRTTPFGGGASTVLSPSPGARSEPWNGSAQASAVPGQPRGEMLSDTLPAVGGQTFQSAVVAPDQPPGSGAVIIKPLVPLGQFRHTFIIAVDDDGVAVIDQHVAHERVLYERIMGRLTAGPLESQRLLTPIVMDLPPDARSALVSHVAQLHQCGFEVEEFGPTSVRVTSMPALLGREQGILSLQALAQDLEGLGGSVPVNEHLRQIAATLACHAAVKANDPLTHDKMLHILEELRQTAYSSVCPHGRPVMLRLSRREIEKNFQRI
ncbi:MAG: DNA mismatch repair endonuclease MutL [Acidobacteria bacterium]|nr:DNA mismatch repair endonuclease MutL [Acidobacteriota bacterium]